jgi:hypothetical protein
VAKRIPRADKQTAELDTSPRPLFDPRGSYSRVELADILKVHPKTVGRWDAKGLLRAIVINGRTKRYTGDEANRLCGLRSETEAA